MFYSPVEDEETFINNFTDLLINNKVKEIKTHPIFVASRYTNNEVYVYKFIHDTYFLKTENPFWI